MTPKEQAHEFWQRHNHESCIIHLLEKVYELESRLSKTNKDVSDLKYKDE